MCAIFVCAVSWCWCLVCYFARIIVLSFERKAISNFVECLRFCHSHIICLFIIWRVCVVCAGWCTRMWYGAHHVYGVICSYAVAVAASSVYFRVRCFCCCYRCRWRRCHSTSTTTAAAMSVRRVSEWEKECTTTYTHICAWTHMCARSASVKLYALAFCLSFPTTIFNALPFLLR